MEKICNGCGCVIETEAVEIDGLFYCTDCTENEEMWFECSHCGKKIHANIINLQATDGKMFCSKKCMTAEGYFACDWCGEVHSENEIEPIRIDDECYCNEDCALNADCEKCPECGDWCSTSNMHWINDDEVYVCDDCVSCSGNYFYCDGCNEYYNKHSLWRDDGDIAICDGCSSYYHVCEDCESIVHQDDVYWVGDDYPHCERCYYSNHDDDEEDEGGDINEWNYKPCVDFYSEEYPGGNYNSRGENPFMGVELEVDGGESPRSLASELTIYDEIYCKHDGSLNCGVEIVSHPCTLWYHTNKMAWRDIMQSAINRNFKSHDAGTCGLHVHVNRDFFGDNKDEQDLHIAKIILIVNRFWDSHIVPFTRRRTGDINQWAQKNSAGRLYNNDTADAKKKKVIDSSRCMGRYVAVNLQNTNTIEFRIFRGTLKYSTFMATLQFVDTICEFAKNISIDDIDNLKWEDIFAGTNYAELNAYLAERTDFKPELASNVFIDAKTITVPKKTYTPIKNREYVAVGDRVIIRSWEDMCDEFEGGNTNVYSIGCRGSFIRGMMHLCGRKATVTGVSCSSINLKFDDVSDDTDFYYSTDMIDVIAKRDKCCAEFGDRVIIRGWEDLKNEYGFSSYYRDSISVKNTHFTEPMKYMCGETGRIIGINNNRISIAFDDTDLIQSWYTITTDMIELLN